MSDTTANNTEGYGNRRSPSPPAASSANEDKITACTQAFFEKNLIDYHEQLHDGFYDCGRSLKSLPLLSSLKKQTPHTGREVILLDTREDPELVKTVDKMLATLSNISDVRSKIHVLSLLVSNYFGGSNSDLISNTERGILALKNEHWTNVLHIGLLQFGVCRHRAVIFKYVADKISIPCRLIRGDYISSNGTEGHAWNVVMVDNKHYLCDIMHDPGTLYEEGSEKADHYKRIQKQEGGILQYAGGPGMMSLPVLQKGQKLADLYNEKAEEWEQAFQGLDKPKLLEQIRMLQEENAIKDYQIEKLAKRLLALDPNVQL